MSECLPAPEERGLALRKARKALGLSMSQVSEVLGAIVGYDIPPITSQLARWEGETSSQLGPITMTALMLMLNEDSGTKAIARAQARINKMLDARAVSVQHRRDLAFKRKHMKRARELGITYEELRAILVEEARAAARAEREAAKPAANKS